MPDDTEDVTPQLDRQLLGQLLATVFTADASDTEALTALRQASSC
jgi:hypothetical protein